VIAVLIVAAVSRGVVAVSIDDRAGSAGDATPAVASWSATACAVGVTSMIASASRTVAVEVVVVVDVIAAVSAGAASGSITLVATAWDDVGALSACDDTVAGAVDDVTAVPGAAPVRAIASGGLLVSSSPNNAADVVDVIAAVLVSNAVAADATAADEVTAGVVVIVAVDAVVGASSNSAAVLVVIAAVDVTPAAGATPALAFFVTFLNDVDTLRYDTIYTQRTRHSNASVLSLCTSPDSTRDDRRAGTATRDAARLDARVPTHAPITRA
jgi:hypothetical protein